MISVILATAQQRHTAELGDLASESGVFTVADVAADSGSLMTALEVSDYDVVLLDAEIGPLAAFDVARALGQQFPDTALVLVAADTGPELLERAMNAGFRGVVNLPLELEDVTTKVELAGTWSRRLRGRLNDPEDERPGRMMVFAGAKGGVGTTTLATHVALETQLANPDRRVCLADFDLQAGDVKTLLDLSHHRSVDDLVEVAQDVTARHLNDALFAHPSGLRVLLPPPQGEFETDITPEVARGILGAVRTRFDLVVVDVGTVMTDGGSMATELADEVLLVVTPDVLSLRSAARLTALWERRRHRKGGITVVLNRSSRDTEVQADLVSRVLEMEVLDATIPSVFRELEPAVNSGIEEHLEDGPIRSAILGLCRELKLIRPQERRSFFGRGGDDSGQATIEALGILPWALLIILVFWQLAVMGWTYSWGEHAVREAARELAIGGPVEQTVREELPVSMHDGLQVRSGLSTVQAQIRVPILVPDWLSPWSITVQQGTIRERGL
ncbi:AAA family ATPase [Euzebya tangerina]|uniref:AAA family ATPase n=1 Tax=Euzebya tangerina TaxID=591198 RepID=UPI000E31E8F6|nr:AAA family ATPase [Euzebya tangerina]